MTQESMYLGVDGGQSHTEAVVASADGSILGRGFGGPSNHAEQPGGRERLKAAVQVSVSEALRQANWNGSDFPVFRSAYFGMTGGADFKEEIIGSIIRAEWFEVGHDAPTALAGATGCAPGIVVISGTGSVVYGEDGQGNTARSGGLGYVFSDEGSGFWLAAQTIRLAIKEQDQIIESRGLRQLVLDYFGVPEIRALTSDFYNEKISRDEIASLAKAAAEAALNGNDVLRDQIRFGAESLAQNVRSVAKRLHLSGHISVAGVGGMFRGQVMRACFKSALGSLLPQADLIDPRFGPAIGALLLAYRAAGIQIDEALLKELEN